ncbi:L,D-transpeptidase family protein [bacterium]|nr:L,D-transpeptidase family protein [bacterium]
MRGSINSYLLFVFCGIFAVVHLANAEDDFVPQEEFYIFVNKEANTLSLRSVLEPKKILKTYSAISGFNAGDKIAEGDRKTPEGIYVTTGRVSESQLYKPLHGPAGIALNYPNPVDRINKQTGSGIWIHGVKDDSRLLKRFDTRGCVAVANENILKLVNWFVPNKTVVVVVDKELPRNNWGLQDADSILEQRVKEWATAWSSQMTEEYIQLYHPDFRSKNMNRTQWKNYKASLNKRYKYIQVEVSNIRTYKHSKYWMTQFDQRYESNLFKSFAVKRLYWVGAENNPLIIAEDSMETKEGPKTLGSGLSELSGR